MNGEEPLDLGPAPGAATGCRSDPLLDRVYSFLLSAIGQVFNGRRAGRDARARAARLRRGRRRAPGAASAAGSLELLDQRERYSPEGDGRPTRFAPGLHFVVGALGIVRTPDVPLPEFRPLTAG